VQDSTGNKGADIFGDPELPECAVPGVAIDKPIEKRSGQAASLPPSNHDDDQGVDGPRAESLGLGPGSSKDVFAQVTTKKMKKQKKKMDKEESFQAELKAKKDQKKIQPEVKAKKDLVDEQKKQVENQRKNQAAMKAKKDKQTGLIKIMVEDLEGLQADVEETIESGNSR